jgi:hypothetical protein
MLTAQTGIDCIDLHISGNNDGSLFPPIQSFTLTYRE